MLSLARKGKITSRTAGQRPRYMLHHAPRASMSSNKLNSNELIDSEAATTAADEAPLIDWYFSINNVVYLVEFRDCPPDDEYFCSEREAWTADFEAMCEALFGDANPLRHTSLESYEYGQLYECKDSRKT